MEAERKLTLYEKSAVPPSTDSFGEYVQVRFGDIVSPRIPSDEPLRLECEQFIAATRGPGRAFVGSREASAVVHVLEALQQSLESGGVPMRLDSIAETPAELGPRLVSGRTA
jgi:hypothetical protein